MPVFLNTRIILLRSELCQNLPSISNKCYWNEYLQNVFADKPRTILRLQSGLLLAQAYEQCRNRSSVVGCAECRGNQTLDTEDDEVTSMSSLRLYS